MIMIMSTLSVVEMHPPPQIMEKAIIMQLEITPEPILVTTQPTQTPTSTPMPTLTPTPKPWNKDDYYAALPEGRKSEDINYIARLLYLFAGNKSEDLQLAIGQTAIVQSKRFKKSIKQIVLSRFRLETKIVNKTEAPIDYYKIAYKILCGQTSIPNQYTAWEYELIAKTLWGEARGESYECEIACGQVILNRSRCWKDTIEETIFRAGQFSVAHPRRSFLNTIPSIKEYECALRVLQGEKVVPDNTIYFHSVSIGKKAWAKARNHKYWGTINRTSFYLDTRYK